MKIAGNKLYNNFIAAKCEFDTLLVQTDRQTNRKAGRQTCRKKDKRIGRQAAMKRQAERWVDRKTGRQAY